MLDLKLLERLIRCKPMSESIEAVNRATDIMREYLESRGVSCLIEELNGRKILYAATSPGKKQEILFNAHLDVVPAPDAMFEPEIREGKLFGRGSSDCLGNAVVIAALLCANVGKKGLSAIFSTDEELGGETTACMVERGYGARKMILILDGSPYAIAHAQKGILGLTLRAHGKGGHASEPWELDNPIDRLIDGYLKLRSAWPAIPADHWGDSMAACILSAGTASNQVPDVAEMVLNIRFVRREDREKILSRIRELTGLEVIVNQTSDPLFVEENTPLMRRLKEEMQKQFPDREISFLRMNGATDARHFAGEGVPIAILGTDGYGMHASGEWVSLKNLEENFELINRFLATI